MNEQMRTWAQISLDNLRSNYSALRAKSEGARFLGVVKADAYGHGAIRVAEELAALGADYLGVASIAEGAALRDAGIAIPIMILGYTPPECAEELIGRSLTQTVADIEAARAYSRRADKLGKSLKIHIKLDTGMGRLGLDARGGAVDAAVEIATMPGLKPEGIFTHFAVSDEADGAEFTNGQFKTFVETVDEIEKRLGFGFEIKHCANSGGVVNYPEMSLDMVRPGIALYGAYTGNLNGLDLKPVMALKTRVAHIYDLRPGESVSYGRTYIADKKRRVAVLPIGYADGLHRTLSGKIDVLINGQRAPQIGRICMDMCMVDITHTASCECGDIVTIFGSGGGEVLPLAEQAEKAGTITYELLCAVSPRVPRIYLT